jgi:hypothetical protein
VELASSTIEGDEAMATRYTTEEAYKKLGISQPTLYRWITEAKSEGHSEKVESQLSVDGRQRLYSLAQLRWLANRHGKELLPDEELHEPQEGVEELRQEVEQLKQLLELKEGETLQLREDIQRLELQVQEMVGKIQAAYSFCEQQVGLVLAELEHIRTQETPTLPPSVPIPHSVSSTESPASDPATQKSSTSSGGRRHYERPSNQTEKSLSQDQHTWTADELFEEGWVDPVEGRLVSRARMCKAHAIPETNVRRDMEKFQLFEMVNQRFLFDGSWKTGGFNAPQRRRVWEEYHERSWFNPCEICLKNQHVEE